MSDSVRVSVIGEFRVDLPNGEVADFRTRRAAEIVARLAFESHRCLPRAELAAEIWPDADRSTRLRNLRPALNYARAAFAGFGDIHSTDDALVLSETVEPDWLQLTMLDTRIRHAATVEERLVQLYSRDHVLQKPLLRGWELEWLERFRSIHDQRRIDSLRQLGDELAARGEWAAALDYGARIRELDPTSEVGIRMQLRGLAELDRLQDAQTEFATYAAHLQTVLELPVSSSLRQVAEEIFAGRFRKVGSRPLTAIQQEMISDVLSVLAEEEPARLLPLLASPKLNWPLVVHGQEMRPILEKVLAATSGWSPERSGVAKRLLQVLSQELDWESVVLLATELLSSDEYSNRVAALNFLGFEQTTKQDYPGALASYERAAKLADKHGDEYLASISLANQAILNISFELYELGLEDIRACIAGMELRTDPNARYGISMIRAWAIAANFAKGDHAQALEAAEAWRTFAETKGTLPYDALGKLFYGLVLAGKQNRESRDWLLAGVDTALMNRIVSVQLDGAFIVARALAELGLVSQGSYIAGEAFSNAKRDGRSLVPFYRNMVSKIPPSLPLPTSRIATTLDLLGFCRERLVLGSHGF